MKRNRLWIIAIVACVMIATTICYISMQQGIKAEYANGRVVDTGTNPDYGVIYKVQWKEKNR